LQEDFLLSGREDSAETRRAVIIKPAANIRAEKLQAKTNARLHHQWSRASVLDCTQNRNAFSRN